MGEHEGARGGGDAGGAALAFVSRWWPLATTLAAAVWAVYTYFGEAEKSRLQRQEQSVREDRTRRIEAQKPFLEQQLVLYFETTKLLGRMAASDPGAPSWAADRRRFRELYWSELAMVEDAPVAAAMAGLETAMAGYEAAPAIEAKRALFRTACLRVAQALHASVERSWTGELGAAP